MPVMDGLEATQYIRELPQGKEVKIIALTASAFQEERNEMLEGGMDDYLSKPYRAAEIYACLSKHLGVKYLYKDSSKPNEQPERKEDITPEMLENLPITLRNNLIEALESLEVERIRTAIEQVSTHNQALHKKLRRLAQNFDYPAILGVLQKGR